MRTRGHKTQVCVHVGTKHKYAYTWAQNTSMCTRGHKTQVCVHVGTKHKYAYTWAQYQRRRHNTYALTLQPGGMKFSYTDRCGSGTNHSTCTGNDNGGRHADIMVATSTQIHTHRQCFSDISSRLVGRASSQSRIVSRNLPLNTHKL